MNEYYLRIEGVNLNNFVYDTGDLSTVRGGGLMLLEAPEWVKSNLPDGVRLEAITEGASWGLFRFQAEDNERALMVAKEVRKKLRTDPNYRYATFVVEVLPKGQKEAYTKRNEELAALCRWRQMNSLSIEVPAPQTSPVEIIRDSKKETIFVCEFDHVRPAAETEPKGGEKFAASESVAVRRRAGIDNKRKTWYERLIGQSLLYDFVYDFKQLSRSASTQDADSKGSTLNQKMAVIYLDGNHFGRKRASYCTDAARQKDFDQKIRKEYQNGTLGILLKEIENHAEADDWLCTEDKKSQGGKGEETTEAARLLLRFETLLWGGDETIWVVPAWNGWWLLSRFFKHVEERWKFFDGSNLTLSAGLVFCHHNAPIQRIVNLAKSLGDLAKGDRTANRVAYQVLESFDHAGTDLEAFRRMRCPEGVSPEDLILDGNGMASIIEPVRTLKRTIPKRRLHRLVESLYLGEDTTGASEELENTVKKALEAEVPGREKTLPQDQALAYFGSGNARWVHLLELWDYIGPEKEINDSGGFS